MTEEEEESYDAFLFGSKQTGQTTKSFCRRLLEGFLWDLHELGSNLLGPFEWRVWMGRIVVSLLVVVVWDIYWNNWNWNNLNWNNNKRKQKQEQPPDQQQQQQQQTQNHQHQQQTDPSSNTCCSSSQQQRPPSQPNETESTTTTTTRCSDDHDHPTETTTGGSVAPTKSKTKTTKTSTNVNANNNDNSSDNNYMDGFHRWYEAETSLYRIYTPAHRDPSVPTIPPYVPNSHRGRVSIEIVVTNRTRRGIDAVWVDYRGNRVPKGSIPPHGGVWKQTTRIDHPWVFEDSLTKNTLLYYVPYKVVPSIPEAPTMGSDGATGVHRFALVENNSNNKNNNNNETSSSPFWIGVSDEVFPFPGSVFLDRPLDAIHWTLKHLSRTVVASNNNNDCMATETATLQKYLANITTHPGVWKYRNLRLCSRHVAPIWNSPLKGLLLAVGFAEKHGHCALGDENSALGSHAFQEIALLSYLLSEWQRKNGSNDNTNNGMLRDQQQPRGASDGFGRAGFGRAGAMGE